MAASSDFASAMTARSLRMVRTELEFLADSSVISRQQLSSILSQLPADANAPRAVQASPSPPRQLAQPVPVQQAPVQSQPPPAPYTPSYSPPASQMSNMSVHEKAAMHNQYASPPPQAPPAYPQVPPVLGLASAMYAYTPTDPGDLALQPQDRIQITEHMNADWWRGRNERTGQEGIFPRSYVNVLDNKAAVPPPPTNYGNMPLEVSQSGQPNPQDPKQNKFEEGGKKFGKKLGNAAIFGAGATVGSNIVNSIF
ncbi:uncharacterized protein N7515_008078 [Penicillium bovifimosum]|uniref:SH3 domain-containing protein n=1 Tax=Penicillium bovifimosum TaxID=126998 RepID=A0A9W9KXH7_9EURO|nr:uncharacterized protein N7515_008078 [Penicillium bovifimosum]KAJ5124253.1 hypothetical protein N7515_008078 [Penicillium bovifimosum]